MKIIIAGSRNFDRIDSTAVTFAFQVYPELFQDEIELVQGGCRTGADKAARDWVDRNRREGPVKTKEFPANWNKHGRAAGPIRNREMAEYADVLILIWDGKSRGSASMKKEMERLGKPVKEIIIKG